MASTVDHKHREYKVYLQYKADSTMNKNTTYIGLNSLYVSLLQ